MVMRLCICGSPWVVICWCCWKGALWLGLHLMVVLIWNMIWSFLSGYWIRWLMMAVTVTVQGIHSCNCLPTRAHLSIFWVDQWFHTPSDQSWTGNGKQDDVEDSRKTKYSVREDNGCGGWVVVWPTPINPTADRYWCDTDQINGWVTGAQKEKLANLHNS